MKNNKAPGEDGITAEFIKELPIKWIVELTEILNGILKEGKMLDKWDLAKICPIYKEGKEEEVTNYRGVSLLNIGYKVLTNSGEKGK